MKNVVFNGFSRKGLDFLAGLERHNNRMWFEKHKEIYQEELLAPGQLFVEDLGQRLQELSRDIEYDPRTNGSGSMLRIYRDVRFSKDKTPYNPYMRFFFWEGPFKKMENAGFFIRIGADGAMVYAGRHGFDKKVLGAYRKRVANDVSGKGLEKVLARILRTKEYETGELHYKRVPREYEADHPRAELLRYNGVWAVTQKCISKSIVQKPELVDAVFAHCKKLLPLHQWLVEMMKRAR